MKKFKKIIETIIVALSIIMLISSCKKETEDEYVQPQVQQVEDTTTNDDNNDSIIVDTPDTTLEFVLVDIVDVLNTTIIPLIHNLDNIPDTFYTWYPYDFIYMQLIYDTEYTPPKYVFQREYYTPPFLLADYYGYLDENFVTIDCPNFSPGTKMEVGPVSYVTESIIKYDVVIGTHYYVYVDGIQLNMDSIIRTTINVADTIHSGDEYTFHY